jgi:hypothetical protein
MLTLFNNTILDTRTDFEKQFDKWIEERNKTKRLNNIITTIPNYSLLPIPVSVLALDTLNGNIESIVSFCRGVNKFFSTCWFIISNLPKISFYACIVIAMCGFIMYSIFDIKKGKSYMVVSMGLYLLIKVFSLLTY